MAIGFGTLKMNIGFLSTIDSRYISVGGIIFIIVGVVISLMDKRNSEKEVPIYKGKEIVGYRRAG